MSGLVYALPGAIASSKILPDAGLENFVSFFDLYGSWVLPVDRTATMVTPLKMQPLFPMPAFRPFTKTYEEICNDRAVEVLNNAEKLGITINVMYSGGIDSTCLLVSLLKNATSEQKKNIVVLLSHESIAENPRFYEEHLKGKIRMGSSITFPSLIGGNDMLLSAEHNDMVMGSDKIGKIIVRHGIETVRKPYDRDMMSAYFSESLRGNGSLANRSLDIFERIRDKAPIPIVSNMEFLWWVNFCIKWHACYYYILMFASKQSAPLVTPEYLDTRFISFYNTDEFQLWSMNNLDKRIRDTWKSYKWVCKDIIYNYTQDTEYRDHKVKRGSLLPLTGYNPPQRFIDAHMRLSADLSLEPYIRTDNDFK